MVLKINDKDIEVRFGLAFVRTLDSIYFVTSDFGTRMGAGLTLVIPRLLNDDVVALATVLHAGTAHLKSRPSQTEIDECIESCEDLEALFKEVLEELKNSNATRLTYSKLLEITADLVETTEELPKSAAQILNTTK